jgi:Integrase core domain
LVGHFHLHVNFIVNFVAWCVSPATVSRVLRRLGLNKLSALEPAEPVRRYVRENPGELIHIDIKKLGRIGSIGHRITGRYPGAVNRHHGIGWEFVHVCIDDASRVAFVQVMANQRKESAVAFLEAATAYYAKLGTLHSDRTSRMGLRARLSEFGTTKLNCPTGSIATIGHRPHGSLKANTRLSVASVYPRTTC